MLVAGNVIIGRKDEGSKAGAANDEGATASAADGHGSYREVPLEERRSVDGHKDEDEDILDLELDELSEGEGTRR